MKIEENGLARRAFINKMIPAELAIRNAVGDVEMLGAHPLLTDAVILLQQAKEKVADYWDGLLEPVEDCAVEIGGPDSKEPIEVKFLLDTVAEPCEPSPATVPEIHVDIHVHGNMPTEHIEAIGVAIRDALKRGAHLQ